MDNGLSHVLRWRLAARTPGRGGTGGRIAAVALGLGRRGLRLELGVGPAHGVVEPEPLVDEASTCLTLPVAVGIGLGREAVHARPGIGLQAEPPGLPLALGVDFSTVWQLLGGKGRQTGGTLVEGGVSCLLCVPMRVAKMRLRHRPPLDLVLILDFKVAQMTAPATEIGRNQLSNWWRSDSAAPNWACQGRQARRPESSRSTTGWPGVHRGRGAAASRGVSSIDLPAEGLVNVDASLVH
eukprot:15295781-Alexandrium_andersonii.AAC.1